MKYQTIPITNRSTFTALLLRYELSSGKKRKQNIKPSNDLPGHTPTVIGFNTTSPWSVVIQLLHSSTSFLFQLQCLPK